MKKRILIIVSCLVFLMNTICANALTYEEVGNAFWMYRWGKVDELIRIESDDTEAISTIDCTFSFDETDVLKEVDGRYLGTHIMTTSFYDLEKNCLTENYKKLADEMYDIPLFRAGSSGNAVEALKLPEDREISYILPDIGYEEYEPEVVYEKTGVNPNESTQVPEKILGALKNNPDAEFMFTIDIKRTYPQETVQFMHFCTDPNGSSDMARLRQAWGIPNPIKVIGLEMGNELYFMDTEYWTEQEQMLKAVNWYINTCIKHANALAEEFPDVKIIPCVDGTPVRGGTSERFTLWNESVILDLAPYIDLIAVHKYYTMSEIIGYVGFECSQIMQYIADTGKDIKIALTEHSTWDGDSISSKLPIKRNSLTAMLDVMKFLCAIVPRNEIHSACYHNYMDSVGWGMIRAGNGTCGKPVVSSIGKAYGMLADNFGTKVIAHSVVSDSIYTDMSNRYNMLASMVMTDDDDKVKVILVNDSSNYRFNINFDIDSQYRLVKKDLITAPNRFSFIYGEQASDLFERQVTTYNNNNPVEQYTMPTKSFVILTLEKIK